MHPRHLLIRQDDRKSTRCLRGERQVDGLVQGNVRANNGPEESEPKPESVAGGGRLELRLGTIQRHGHRSGTPTEVCQHFCELLDFAQVRRP